MAAIPYRLALTIGCLALASVYMLRPEVRPSGRVVVAALTALSFYLPAGVSWYIVSILMQLGVSIFVILRLTLRP
jgi:hypothetical protein